MSDRVTISLADGVADVRMNRADKMNAIDTAMFEGLVNAGRELAGNPKVRAVVLSGNGRAFCAGLDFASFMGMATQERPARNIAAREEGNPANFAQMAAYVWTTLPVPVIAAVHGVAFGGGLQIALGADIRYIAPDAKMSVMEIKWGLIPDMSGTQTLRHHVRLDVMKELTFTGRIVEGREAAALGLVTRLAEHPRAAALAMARELAEKSPDAIRAGKRLLNAAPLGSVADGLKLEEALQLSLIGSPNQLEAVQANLEKRPPVFREPQG